MSPQVKNGLSLSQIVAFFPSGSVGCSRCSGTRLSLHFLQFWSDVACRQEPLEGLVYALSRDFWNQVTTCCLDKPNRFASHCLNEGDKYFLNLKLSSNALVSISEMAELLVSLED